MAKNKFESKVTTAPKGKPYVIGTMKAKTAAEALKKARKHYSYMNVSVKLYRKGKNGTLSKYTVYSPHKPF